MKNEMRGKKGITLIALVITIIVLLILAGLTIATLTGDNGLLQKSANAKNANEVAREIEQLKLAYQNMKFENEDDIFKRRTIFQAYLDNDIGEAETIASIYGNGYSDCFINSNRSYTIDEYGELSPMDSSILDKKDENPGTLEIIGTNQYEINSIEDLVAFSKNVNGGNNYSGKRVYLGKTLDFFSELSYAAPQKNYVYDDGTKSYIEDEENGTKLIRLMIQDRGFIPIGIDNTNSFNGIFDGNNNEIRNIYINTSEVAGLFGYAKSQVKNITISGKITSTNTVAGGIIAVAPIGGSYPGVSKCNNYADVYGKGSVGGIIGVVGWGGSVSECSSDAYIYSSYSTTNGIYRTVGGIIGSSAGDGVNVIKCKSKGEIKGECVAGICGSGSVQVRECVVSGKVDGSKYAGGIVVRPEVRDVSIWNCVVDSEAIVTSESRAAGIFGWTSNCGSMYIYNCCVLGKIIAPTVAGISGWGGHYWQLQASIKNCYFAGTLEGTSKSGLQAAMNYNKTEYITLENNYYIDTIDSAVYNKQDSELTGVTALPKERIKGEIADENGKVLLNYLNDYVDAFNADQQNKTKLLTWIYDEKTRCPILKFE